MSLNIVIFGANSEIISSVANLYAKQRSNFFLISMNMHHLESNKNLLLKNGANRVKIYSADLFFIDKHKKIINSIFNFFNGVDIAILSFAVLGNNSLYEKYPKKIEDAIYLNTISSSSILLHLANKFQLQNYGSIVYLSSIAGDFGKSSNYIYGASKSYMNVVMSGLRQRLYANKITLTTIILGPVKTKMTKNLKQKFYWLSSETSAKLIYNAIERKKEIAYIPKYLVVFKFLYLIIFESIYKRFKF